MSPILLCLSDVEIIFPFIIHCTSYYLQTFVELLDEAANAPLFHFISHEIKIGADSFQSLIVLRQVTVYDRTKLNLKGSKMAFDFKKEYKEFYMSKNQPEIVNVPKANYIAVRGSGDPNEEGGAYQQAIGILYAVAYTLKMSYKTAYKIKGFFEYVVPPLEGFWWQDHVDGVDYSNKSSFNWISVIRLPDFISKKDFDWAVKTATIKKKLDCSSAEFLTVEEGLCVQIMHHSAFDDKPASVALMDAYLEKNGYKNDLSKSRLHHEIYLSDAREVPAEKQKTVIRHPIKSK